MLWNGFTFAFGIVELNYVGFFLHEIYKMAAKYRLKLIRDYLTIITPCKPHL